MLAILVEIVEYVIVMYRRVVSKSSKHYQLLFSRLSYLCKSNWLLIIIPQAMGQSYLLNVEMKIACFGRIS